MRVVYSYSLNKTTSSPFQLIANGSKHHKNCARCLHWIGFCFFLLFFLFCWRCETFKCIFRNRFQNISSYMYSKWEFEFPVIVRTQIEMIQNRLDFCQFDSLSFLNTYENRRWSVGIDSKMQLKLFEFVFFVISHALLIVSALCESGEYLPQ